MELINSRYKILECIEKEYCYSQYLALDLLKKGEKVLLYLVEDTATTRPFIEYCNNNFYEVSSYKQKGIVHIYSYGIVETIDDKQIEEKVFFYTTEYVDSISLTEIDEPFEEYEILDVYKQLSRALDFLYYHGIVYKYMGVETIKLIKKDGKLIVKLLDIISIYRMEIIKTYLHPLTYSFIAPEIERGMPLAGCTDVYSLGALLYYLLTLKPLYHKHLNSEIKDYFNNRNDSLKFKLLNLIQKMTSVDIENRYKTLHECNDFVKEIYGLDVVIENIKDVDKINFKISLIGREHELRKILNVCEVREGRIGKFNKDLILINGDKGVGKTRLVSEVSHLMKWDRYKTFSVDMNQQGEGFKGMIENVLKQFIKISSDTHVAKYGKELVKLVPELGLNRDIVPTQILPKEQEQLRLYDRVANFMLDVSLNHASVLLIDDFHLADKSTIEFVDYLFNLNRIRKAPLLLILAYRDEQFYCHKNKDYISKWSLNSTLSIRLSRLTMEETAKMIKHILGWHKEPLNFASRIMRDTEGTPGYIEEVMKELYSQKLLLIDYSNKYKGFAPTSTVDDYDKIVLSQNIDESILKQVKSLDATTREILDAAALFNTAISKDIISSMLQTKEEDKDYDNFFANLTQLKILSEKFDDWGYTYGFYNKDFKKHIYNNIEEGQRTELHTKASNILEELYVKEGRENKDELIYHLIQSNQKDKAIDYCIQSGVGMLKLFIYEQAYSFFKRAYELLEDDKDTRKLIVVFHLGEICQSLLKNNDAAYYFDYSIQLANLQNSPEKSIDAKNKIGIMYSIRGDFDLAVAYLNKSIGKANEIKYVKGIMEAAYSLTRVYMQMRELKKMKIYSEKYFEYATEQNDLYYMGMFMAQRGIVEYFEENIMAALDLFKKSVQYLEKANKIEETSKPINNIGVIYHEHFQDTHNARIYFQKALRISEQYHRTDAIITFTNNIAESYIIDHDYYKAIDVLKKNLELAFDYEDEISILLVYTNLITSYTNIGEYKQAHTYLLKGRDIYENRKLNQKGIYLETYLEACAKLYMAMGAYDEALIAIEEFFEKFSHTEFLIQLRMRKLYYFAKYYNGNLVEDRELIELIADYRETPYIRDRRILLLEGAEHFIKRSMIAEAQSLLEEDRHLVNRVNNDYLTLKREYIKSFLLTKEDQVAALEELFLNQNLEKFKHLQWKLYVQLGNLQLELKEYFRAVNNFLNALDIVNVLFNKIPLQFKKSYLLKDDKFVVRANLFKMENLITGNEINEVLYANEYNYERYREDFVVENDIEHFFDILELQNVLKNRRFYELALEHYDKVNKTVIKNIENLVAALTDNNIMNLNYLLQLACRTTLAARGAIIRRNEDGYEIATTVGQGISNDKISSILDSTSSMNKEVLTKNSLSITRDFDKDIKASIILPVYQEHEDDKYANIKESDRRNYSRFDRKIIGYLYLETDKLLNNFSEETLNICKKLVPLAGVLLTNHYLTIFSSIDKMTGTYMRKYFEQVLDEEIQRAKMMEHCLSVIMLDIDNFKNINDIYGHQKGDIVLTEIGKIIKKSIRSTDYVGRYGGEEFIVLLPNTNKEDAYNIAEKIRKRVEKSILIGNDIQLTISCGTSTFPGDGNKQAEIIEKADKALYMAKENGKNQSVQWEPGIDLKNKRVDKLAGIVTGNIIHDQRNVLVITEIIELISEEGTIEDKIYTVMGRLIEILEAEESILFTIENGAINKKYYRRRFVDNWTSAFPFNKYLVTKAIKTMQGRYIIDWEDISSFDTLTNTPNWKSVIVMPIVVNKDICGVIYLSVPIKEKEFDYNAYNLVEITSNIVGAILKINK